MSDTYRNLLEIECEYAAKAYKELENENKELRDEVERLRETLLFINDQLPINSALKPHIAHAIEKGGTGR